jgi:hypothetical protein
VPLSYPVRFVRATAVVYLRDTLRLQSVSLLLEGNTSPSSPIIEPSKMATTACSRSLVGMTKKNITYHDMMPSISMSSYVMSEHLISHTFHPQRFNSTSLPPNPSATSPKSCASNQSHLSRNSRHPKTRPAGCRVTAETFRSRVAAFVSSEADYLYLWVAQALGD